MIRVGVDAWNLPGDRRGIGRYLREILRVWRSKPRRVDVTLVVPEWHTWTVRNRYRAEVDGVPYRVVSRALHRRAGLDGLWFPFNGCSWTNFSLPAVATLHDASNFVLADYAPQTQAIFRAAASRCQALLTDSCSARDELARELQLPPERLQVVYPGAGPPRQARPIALDVAALQPFLLYVGAAEARKGFDTLLEAMALLHAAAPELQLVTTSSLHGWTTPDGVRVRALGYVDDDTLAALYRHCIALVFPSRHEGFGLPVVEAMSYGAAAIVSDAAGVPEAGGDAARYVPAGNAPALAHAALDVYRNDAYRARLQRLGPAHARGLTWERTATQTLEAIEAALK